jgi:hypothetical protein
LAHALERIAQEIEELEYPALGGSVGHRSI